MNTIVIDDSAKLQEKKAKQYTSSFIRLTTPKNPKKQREDKKPFYYLPSPPKIKRREKLDDGM